MNKQPKKVAVFLLSNTILFWGTHTSGLIKKATLIEVKVKFHINVSSSITSKDFDFGIKLNIHNFMEGSKVRENFTFSS